MADHTIPDGRSGVDAHVPADAKWLGHGHPSMEAPRAKIVTRNLNFYYGDVRALRDVNSTFYDHRVTALIGPSGCGKSTLLRVFNRMYSLYRDQRAEGEVLLEGENILDRAENLNGLRARVGMVFQKPTPFPMSIYDNIAFGIRQYERLSRAELDSRIERALERAGLWKEVKDLLRQSGLSLSGGQQQRLCIARAIAVDPEVLLLDEPCSALDPRSTSHVEELISELRAHYCIVIVTHNLGQAGRVSDYAALMYLGTLIEFSSTADMFTNPRDPRAIAYIEGHFG